MNDMLKQILNEAFQHVILESCLRYRHQKEAQWIHQSIELEQRNFTVLQIIDPITPIKVYYLSI
jgi:Leu/Phe-tRNA-protein transferase